MTYLGDSGSGLFMRLQSRYRLRLQATEGLAEDGRSNPKVQGWEVGAGCWQKASVLCQRDLSKGWFEFPHDKAVGVLKMQ